MVDIRDQLSPVGRFKKIVNRLTQVLRGRGQLNKAKLSRCWLTFQLLGRELWLCQRPQRAPRQCFAIAVVDVYEVSLLGVPVNTADAGTVPCFVDRELGGDYITHLWRPGQWGCI